MCSDAPNIVFEDRKLWSYLRGTDPKASQLSFSAPFQFLTIGPESEWHQAAAYIGTKKYLFSARAPLIIPQACPPSTVIIRPFRRAQAGGTGDIGPQPRTFSPDDGVVVPATENAAAFLHVVAYDKLPSVWPFVRPDLEYQQTYGTAAVPWSSTETKTFSCPVMGRRRFSWYAQQNSGDLGLINYRFTGLTAFDDSLREETLLDSSIDTSTAGFTWSRHLDVDSDSYDWITLYIDTAIVGGGSIENLFWVRD